MKKLFELIITIMEIIKDNVRRFVFGLDLTETCYKLAYEMKDEKLTEENMMLIYDKISVAFYKKYKLEIPRLVLDEEIAEIFCGIYTYKDCTIKFSLKNILEQKKKMFICLATDIDIFISLVLHELRHHWQYHNLKEEYMWWVDDNNRNTYAALYNECPLEIDANRFASSTGYRDNDKVFVSLPLKLYKNYHNSNNLKEEIEAGKNIDNAIALYKKSEQ